MITLEEIHNLIEQAKQAKLDCPVCIPSYKFRETSWLVRNLHTIDTKVYLFIYEDDYTDSGYSEFNWSDNVTIVKIREQDFKNLNLRWRGIQPKRRFIQLYMEKLNITEYFMIDDDYKELYTVKEKHNDYYKKQKIPIDIVLKIIFLYNKQNHYNLLGIFHKYAFFGFTKLKGILDRKLVHGFYYFKDFNIPFCDKNIHEDNKLFFDLLKSNLKFGILDFICDSALEKNTHTVANVDVKIHINDYLENPQWIKFHMENNHLSSAIDFKKVKNNNQSIDIDLYNIAKTYNVEKIINYIKNNKEFEEW